jgi:nitrogen regulatory protein P-II 1
MRRVEIIVAPTKFDEVQDALLDIGVDTMTLNEIKYVDPASRRREVFRGSAYVVNFVPKVRMEFVVEDAVVPQVIEAVRQTLEDAGADVTKVVVSEVSEVQHIRGGGRAERAHTGLRAPVRTAAAERRRPARVCPAS